MDWKTGRGEGRFNEVQLAGYALYAAEKGWVSAPEELRTELAYLVIPRYVRRKVDEKKLAMPAASSRRAPPACARSSSIPWRTWPDSRTSP